MLHDRYDNPITTSSQAARDAYIDGVDKFLAAQSGAIEAFEQAAEADPGFALAHMGLARTLQVMGRGAEAQMARQAAVTRSLNSCSRPLMRVAGPVIVMQ